MSSKIKYFIKLQFVFFLYNAVLNLRDFFSTKKILSTLCMNENKSLQSSIRKPSQQSLSC